MGVEQESQTLDYRFEVGPASELSVSNVSGRISIEVGDGAEIYVKASKRGSVRARDNTQVDVRRDGNKVSVQTRSGPVGLINFGRASRVDYHIVVPRDCRVQLHAVSSEVDLRGTRAEVALQTVSGNVRVQDVAGDITITTVSGDIDAADLSGTLVARTTSGDGRISTSRLRRFSIHTVSGDFAVQTPLIVDEHCNAKTVSGDLELTLPVDTGATVQLKSISGSVACDLPAEIIKAGRRHWQGRINGGGGHVEMDSVSGDLRIKGGQHAETGPATSGEEPEGVPDIGWPVLHADASSRVEQEPVGDTGASDVLLALQRGEISVEEAMAKLDESR